ncbi:MAG: GntR family transcriptional regulator [Verrucomicrobia bacterium]|nr:GntR family transcriptional regulator [Verrucomicrobiota bacterium]
MKIHSHSSIHRKGQRRKPRINLTEQSYARIRAALLGSEMPLGERFSINQLSTHLGIGRSPVRDAVNRLAAQGVLQTVAKSGIIIRPVSLEEFQDIVGLRESLEPYAVSQACARMDYVQHAELRALCHQMAGLARRIRAAGFQNDSLNAAMHQADWSFHSLILASCGNATLRKIVEDHRLLLRKVRYPSLATTRHLACTLREHWRIYRALARGDAAAACEWMRRHARRGGNAMLESWRQEQEKQPGTNTRNR